ncbi:phosphatidylinositol 4-phosphate 5-kinase 7-like [Camponotus floridanus]|uniref:phosphatidylinositol 4-phosphate 5-kinase 7-like n=1 Tax=Camponotus floridanus TaxID=104421 RepID=UPI000DC6728A|nr:phosphatidylinositol 4-phosphate 5-kinase 7-like [Camponotus floridanus]
MKDSSEISKAESNVRIGIAKFTFENGDNYEGKYQVDFDKCTLVKQDQGVYVTDNFDVYNGTWHDDKFAGKFHIRYNNNAQYKGNIDRNGAMNGIGTYIFPDDSSLMALWSQNKPISDVIYQKPLGYKWKTESVSNNVCISTCNIKLQID